MRAARSRRVFTTWSASLLAVAAACAALAAPRAAHAQAPLITGLGGPGGYGTGNLAPNDDGSSAAIDISAAFPAGLRFFGMTFRQVYVNNNGNITFGGPLGTYTPRAFPVASQRMIAPWWGDVDTRPDGRPTRNGVYWDIRPGQFTVTWHNVGYFANHSDQQNDFQMILRAASDCGVGDFDVEFRYNRCEWTTGDASCGRMGHCPGACTPCVPTQAGFDGGDSTNYFALPGSLTEGILMLCRTSNVGMNGVWRFRIRGGALPCMGSGEPCQIPTNVGACRNGTQQCRGAMTACVQSTMPRPELCDGVDNDCNGMTDDGMMLCPAGQVCDRGSCVPRCVEGGCFEGQVCTDRGTCVETACATMTCPDGQRCIGGRCIEPCGDVYCPPPTVCRAGRCVDTCAGMTCDSGQVCEDGRCQLRCQCRPCPMGQTCQMDGRCVPSDCVSVMCGAGTVCRAGRCVDPCMPPSPDVRVCGFGEMCSMGRCVPAVTPPPDGGVNPVDGGVRADAGDPRSDGGTPPVGDGGAVDGGRRDGGGFVGGESGCACRTTAPAHSGTRVPWALGFAVAALAAQLRRRRR